MEETKNKEKNNCLEEKIAIREYVVSDQGNDTSYCDNCKYDLGSDPCKRYDKCPGCDYYLIEWLMPIDSRLFDF